MCSKHYFCCWLCFDWCLKRLEMCSHNKFVSWQNWPKFVVISVVVFRKTVYKKALVKVEKTQAKISNAFVFNVFQGLIVLMTSTLDKLLVKFWVLSVLFVLFFVLAFGLTHKKQKLFSERLQNDLVFGFSWKLRVNLNFWTYLFSNF